MARYFLLIVFLSLGLFASEDQLWQQELKEKIDDFLLHQKTRPFSGVVLVAQDSTIIYQKAFGNATENKKNTLESRFNIASVSKQFTASMILQLVDENKLNLTDSLVLFFPEIPFEWKNKVQIHHLLNHTSGLRGLKRPLFAPVGSRFEYNNLNYILLGKILEQIHQKPYNSIASEFFQSQSLNMQAIPHRSIPMVLLQIPHFAVGSYEDSKSQMKKRGTFDVLSFNPTGGLVASAFDLWQWNQKLHQGKVLSEESYQKMTTPVLERNYRFGKLGYGYGIHHSQIDEINEFFHSGFIKGYMSALYYYPQEKISLVVLENQSFWQLKPQRLYAVPDRLRFLVRQQLIQLKKMHANDALE